MPFTPACPACGGTDCDQVAENEYSCNDCENNFIQSGGYYENNEELFNEGDSLDMQAFEDRISCLGDE